jgi:hypothetical protein
LRVNLVVILECFLISLEVLARLVNYSGFVFYSNQIGSFWIFFFFFWKNFTLVHRETLAKALDELGNNPGAILSDERYKDAFYGVSEEILKRKIQKFEDYYDYICKDPSWKKRPGSYLEGPSATRPRLIREASSSQPARAQGALQEQIQQMCNTAVDAAFESILPILSLAPAQGASSSQPAQGAQREQIQQAFDTALERILPILKDLLDRRPPNDNDNLQ